MVPRSSYVRLEGNETVDGWNAVSQQPTTTTTTTTTTTQEQQQEQQEHMQIQLQIQIAATMTPQNRKNPTNLVETSPVTKACDAIGRAFDPRDANLQEGAEPLETVGSVGVGDSIDGLFLTVEIVMVGF